MLQKLKLFSDLLFIGRKTTTVFVLSKKGYIYYILSTNICGTQYIVLNISIYTI
ncbi:hypothetical protein LCGC14_0404080 [marine sediment metagenome]|uniref:Uncharacterized protein n=1 Tax=marine sediment metagenome TaxID=412755 RepID=A0A0F9T1I2_9ZZZZ